MGNWKKWRRRKKRRKIKKRRRRRDITPQTVTPRLRRDDPETGDKDLEVEAEGTEMGADKGLGAEMRKEDTRESPVKRTGGAGLEAETEEREEDHRIEP